MPRNCGCPLLEEGVVVLVVRITTRLLAMEIILRCRRLKKEKEI